MEPLGFAVPSGHPYVSLCAFGAGIYCVPSAYRGCKTALLQYECLTASFIFWCELQGTTDSISLDRFAFRLRGRSGFMLQSFSTLSSRRGEERRFSKSYLLGLLQYKAESWHIIKLQSGSFGKSNTSINHHGCMFHLICGFILLYVTSSLPCSTHPHPSTHQ